ncbi:MAG: ParA family protein [Limnothrix sp.]|nr:ParA family protein [Limnothrix sp.]
MASTTIAIVNPKGGVGKTTTVLCLAELLAARSPVESPVVMVDLDPQAHLTALLGATDSPSIATTLQGQGAIGDRLVAAGDRGWLLPGGLDLESAAVALARSPEGLLRLRQALAQSWPLLGKLDEQKPKPFLATSAAQNQSPLVLLDCPPGLGFWTLSALAAADGLLIPVQCQPLALRSLLALMETVASVRSQLNPNLRVVGVLPTMSERRAPWCDQVLAGLQDWALASRGAIALFPPIPRSACFPKLTVDGKLLRSGLARQRRSVVLQGYEAIAAVLVDRPSPTNPT